MKHQWMAGTSPKATRKAKDSVLHTQPSQHDSAPTPLQATVSWSLQPVLPQASDARRGGRGVCPLPDPRLFGAVQVREDPAQQPHNQVGDRDDHIADCKAQATSPGRKRRVRHDSAVRQARRQDRPWVR